MDWLDASALVRDPLMEEFVDARRAANSTTLKGISASL
jgi:hypothetical protein